MNKVYKILERLKCKSLLLNIKSFFYTSFLKYAEHKYIPEQHCFKLYDKNL